MKIFDGHNLFNIIQLLIISSFGFVSQFSYSRYYVIVHPLKAQYLCTVKKAQKTVALTWMIAIILAYPVTMVQVGNLNKENKQIEILRY